MSKEIVKQISKLLEELTLVELGEISEEIEWHVGDLERKIDGATDDYNYDLMRENEVEDD